MARRAAGVVVGGFVLMALANLAAIFMPVGVIHEVIIVTIAFILASVITGFAAGILLGKRGYISVMAPILYFGSISILLSNPVFLWLNSSLPLCMLFCVLGAFLGSKESKVSFDESGQAWICGDSYWMGKIRPLRWIILRVLRALLISFWLYMMLSYGNVYYETPYYYWLLVISLAFATAYDVAMLFIKLRNVNLRLDAVPFILYFIAAVSLIFSVRYSVRYIEYSWDYPFGYAPLSLYVIDMILYPRTRVKRIAMAGSVLLLSLIVIFFTQYRVGMVTAHSDATLGGRPVTCQIIKVIDAPRFYIILGDRWGIVDIEKNAAGFSRKRGTFFIKNIAFIDIESGFDVEMKEFSEGASWDPKLSYENGRLSFYFKRKELFVCDGIDLKK